jgi:hypothetical protein
MIPKHNKKGLGFFMIVALVVAFIVVSIFASYFGLNLLKETINSLGIETILIALVFVLALVFKEFVKQILEMIVGLLKWIVALIKSAI